MPQIFLEHTPPSQYAIVTPAYWRFLGYAALNEQIHWKQLKGRMGLDWLESHRLKRLSGRDFSKLTQCHTIFQVKYCNALKGSLVGITRKTQRVINKQVLQTVLHTPNQRPLGHRKTFSIPRVDRYLLKMMRAYGFVSSPRLRAQRIRRTGRHLSVRFISRRLFNVGYYSRGPARCPWLTLVHRRRRCQWTKRHRVWDTRQ